LAFVFTRLAAALDDGESKTQGGTIMRKWLIGVMAVTAALFAVVTFAAGSGSVVSVDCTAKAPGSCDGKASLKFWNSAVDSCYSLKASCKGDFVGTTWTANLSDVGKTANLSTSPDPSCAASASDSLALVTGLKASCKTASVDYACGDLKGSSTKAKASLKIAPDLCTPCCGKPDKITGCAGVCEPPPCGNALAPQCGYGLCQPGFNCVPGPGGCKCLGSVVGP
jgi:hypothetical protein